MQKYYVVTGKLTNAEEVEVVLSNAMSCGANRILFANYRNNKDWSDLLHGWIRSSEESLGQTKPLSYFISRSLSAPCNKESLISHGHEVVGEFTTATPAKVVKARAIKLPTTEVIEMCGFDKTKTHKAVVGKDTFELSWNEVQNNWRLKKSNPTRWRPTTYSFSETEVFTLNKETGRFVGSSYKGNCYLKPSLATALLRLA